jgi:peptidoglycan-associated lipoprotein
MVMKRNLIILTLLVFACSSVFLLSSCAKKQVVAEEEEITAPAEPEVEIAVEEALPPEEVAEEKAEEVVVEVEEEEEPEKEEMAEVETLEEVELARIREAEAEEKALRERRAAQFEGESIYFDFDKSFIKTEYRPVLEGKGDFLKDSPYTHIRIEGNCDERGTNEYNLALGERRANSAKNFLVSLGVSPDRIETISYGEERPLFLGHNEQAWSQNRRDDFVIIEE